MNLLDVLKIEKKSQTKGGIYHKLQVEMTYNSNHIEGSKLTKDQTRYIYETNTIGADTESIDVNDVIETANHFSCISKAIDNACNDVTEEFIKELHYTLKNGTSDSRNEWFAVGEYKKRPNEVGGEATTKPADVSNEMAKLINSYNGIKEKNFNDIIDFHYKFERIHPFQDGNGRVGRLLMLKECLRFNIVPFMVDEELKMFYYRGLAEYETETGFLRDTCLSAQDKFKEYLKYFEVDFDI